MAVYHTIDSTGKLEVHLSSSSSTSVHIFTVSESPLRLASPVLAKMVDPASPFSEGIRHAHSTSINQPKTIQLHEDDPTALEILFKLFHFQNKQIPEIVEFEVLYKLAQLCDKYDCIDVAKPLIHEFAEHCQDLYPLKDIITSVKNYGSLSEQHWWDIREEWGEKTGKWLYISYLFEMEGRFGNDLAVYLMLWVPKREGEGDEKVEGPVFLPDGLYVHFMSTWESIRNNLVNSVNNIIQKYTYGKLYYLPTKCLHDQYNTLCDISLYGSFIRRLHYQKIFPISEKSELYCLAELAVRIKKADIGSYHEYPHGILLPHRKCKREVTVKLHERVDAAVEGVDGIGLGDVKEYRRKMRRIDGGEGERFSTVRGEEDDEEGEEEEEEEEDGEEEEQDEDLEAEEGEEEDVGW